MARRGWIAGFAGLALTAVYPAAGSSASPAVAVEVRFSQDAGDAKLVFDVSRPVTGNAFALSAPDRIVVDLSPVNFQVDASAGRLGPGRDGDLVKSFRFGMLADGKSRVVIDLARRACPVEVSAKPIVEGAQASRLTIDLKPCEPQVFAALVRSAPAAEVAVDAARQAAEPPVVVLDPGHGGADSGARGLGGVQEKTLVLAFCGELKRRLEATKRYKVVMTRTGDQYVDLDDRVAIGRSAGAALFVSVHADTLSDDSGVSGSTVYTVADRASDAEAARIAQRENAASGGQGEAKAAEDPGVADILFDLKRRETRLYAHIFSRGLVDSLHGATRLNHNPERSAGFVVLKAPEFPSVLVELGYLSNREDVQSMTSTEWRGKTAAAMVSAIDAFFSAPGYGHFR
jgi:N-acetylmuramoyl-L-alanine amidase